MLINQIFIVLTVVILMIASALFVFLKTSQSEKMENYE